MSHWDEGLGVNTDDPEDIEVGCVVYSRTHFKHHDFPRGGTVIRLNIDADDDSLMGVVVMEQNAGRLDTFEIDPRDVDMETAEFYGRNAKVAAEIINRWLGSKSGPKDTQLRLRWQREALDLAEAAASGQWLPGAEKRARWHAEEQRRERASEASS